MNILHVINSSNPAGGGPIESIAQAHLALHQAGHRFEIVCLDPPDAAWLKNFPLSVHATGPALSRYRYSPRLVPWIRAHAARFDCAIVHGVWRFPSLAAYRALRGTGVPFFLYTHGMLDPAFRTLFPVRHAIKSLWWKTVEYRVVRDARAVFFTCEEERRLAHESFKPLECRDALVPYCVGEPPGDPEVQKQSFLQRFPQLRAGRFILFLSRIHPKKGCDLLIRAFAEAAAGTPDTRLAMAGPDPVGWADELRNLAERLGVADRITWTGMLSGDLKWGAFRSADVFVLPSHQENFGIAVVEALSCGVPVLTTDRVNIWREIQADGAALIGRDTSEGAKRMLEEWLGLDQKKRETMRGNARTCFAARFRSAEAAANLLAVLREHGVREK